MRNKLLSAIIIAALFSIPPVFAKDPDVSKDLAKARKEVAKINKRVQKDYHKLALATNKLAGKLNRLSPEDELMLESKYPASSRILETGYSLLSESCAQLECSAQALSTTDIFLDASAGILGGTSKTKAGKHLQETYKSTVKKFEITPED